MCIRDSCLIVCETSLEQIYVHIKNTRPDLVIIDSIPVSYTHLGIPPAASHYRPPLRKGTRSIGTDVANHIQ